MINIDVLSCTYIYIYIVICGSINVTRSPNSAACTAETFLVHQFFFSTNINYYSDGIHGTKMTDIAVTYRYNSCCNAFRVPRDAFFVSHKIHYFCGVEIVTVTCGQDDLISPGTSYSRSTRHYVLLLLLFNVLRATGRREPHTSCGRTVL